MRTHCRALLLVAAAALAGCRSSQTAAVSTGNAPAPEALPPGYVRLPPDSPKLRRIRVEPVAVRQFPDAEIVAPGKVEVNPNRISRINVPVAGRIVEVFVRLGAAVEQGQPLVTVDSVEAGAAIAAYRQAQAQARVAASALNKADADLTRLKELHAHKAAALKEVIAAQNDFTQAQAAVEQTQTAREEARHRLELLGLDTNKPTPVVTVRAPLAGKVLDISVVPGEFRNDTNAPLMTIADLSTVWITSEIPENQIRQITLGERIRIELAAFPGQEFQGQVRRIADTLDPQTRTVKVQAEFDNRAGRLRPEMFGRILHSHGERPVLVVPASAVLESGNAPTVAVERGAGLFEFVTVQTGEPRNGSVPVLAGLKAGDRVVVDGAILLRN